MSLRYHMPLSGKLADASQLDIDPRYQLDIPRNGDAPRYFVLVFFFQRTLGLGLGLRLVLYRNVSLPRVFRPCALASLLV